MFSFLAAVATPIPTLDPPVETSFAETTIVNQHCGDYGGRRAPSASCEEKGVEPEVTLRSWGYL